MSVRSVIPGDFCKVTLAGVCTAHTYINVKCTSVCTKVSVCLRNILKTLSSKLC